MKVSIITVVYNSVETIEDCVQSVLNQDYPDVEYIVIDGGSNDGTLEILRQYEGRIASIISEPDKGIYDAMNKGLAMCSGELVGILNSDDLYADGHVISDIVDRVEGTGVDSCYADLLYVSRHNTSDVKRRWIAGPFDAERFLKGWMPPHPTFFLKRICYERFGRFNLEFKTSADYELMLRMLLRYQVSSTYLNRVTVLMRTGGQSNVSLKNRILANVEDRKAWKVNGLKPPFFTTLRKPLSKIGQFFRK